MNTTVYRVTGMTCAHCAGAVSTELGELPGVEHVDVDLDTGEVAVTSEAPLDDGAVAQAIEDAGYALAGPGDLPLA